MAAARQVVELVDVKPEDAVGSKVERDEATRSKPVDKEHGKARLLPRDPRDPSQEIVTSRFLSTSFALPGARTVR